MAATCLRLSLSFCLTSSSLTRRTLKGYSRWPSYRFGVLCGTTVNARTTKSNLQARLKAASARQYSWKPSPEKYPKTPQKPPLGLSQTQVNLLVLLAAGFCGTASLWLISNSLSPTIYQPPVPDLNRNDLGMTPTEFANLAQEGNSVALLTADLSHLRAKLLLLTKGDKVEDVMLSGRKEEIYVQTLKADLNCKAKPHTLVGGPELLVKLAGTSKSKWGEICDRNGLSSSAMLGDTSSLWTASLSPSTSNPHRRYLVVFRPTELDDQLVKVSWENILNLYVRRTFPGHEFAAVRDSIHSHSEELISQPLPFREEKMSPLTAEQFLQGARDVAAVKRLLGSYMGVFNSTEGTTEVNRYFVQDRPVRELDSVAIIPLP